MKFEYSSPLISVEVLDKTDVLLTSVIVPPDPAEKEKENAYRDIFDFIFKNRSWF